MFQYNQNQNTIPQVNQQQVSFVKNLLARKGMSAEAMVRQLCSQRGINVEEYMEQFRDVTLP